MKKAFSLLLALLLCFCLCACGVEDEDRNTNNSNSNLFENTEMDDDKQPADNDNQTNCAVSGVTWRPLNFSCKPLFNSWLATFEFTTNTDGTADSYGTLGTWQLDGNTLTVTYPAATVVHKLTTYGDISVLLSEGFIYSSVPVGQLPTDRVELTLQNYTDFFEIKTFSGEIISKDQFGQITQTATRAVTMLVLKEEYARRLIGDQSQFLFRYQDGLGNNKDSEAIAYSCDGVYYPIYGDVLQERDENPLPPMDISQFPMVKAQGTLVLIADR